jgi:hypothetical protein
VAALRLYADLRRPVSIFYFLLFSFLACQLFKNRLVGSLSCCPCLFQLSAFQFSVFWRLSIFPWSLGPQPSTLNRLQLRPKSDSTCPVNGKVAIRGCQVSAGLGIGIDSQAYPKQLEVLARLIPNIGVLAAGRKLLGLPR